MIPSSIGNTTDIASSSRSEDNESDSDADEEEDEEVDGDDDEAVLVEEEDDDRTNDCYSHQQHNNNDDHKDDSPLLSYTVSILVHATCIGFYLIPLYAPSISPSRQAVLDELHIVSSDNMDVNGISTIGTIFSNDYWGRPMNSPSSHKSWRPLTILSFRYLRGGMYLPDIAAHRLFNVLTHTCIAELIGILAIRLYPHHPSPTVLRIMTTILWALHPTHVEVTANAANRPHLLAVLCSVLLCDPSISISLFLLAIVVGFLSSETFLFQVVPAAVNLVAIVYLRQFYNYYCENSSLVRHGSNDLHLIQQLITLSPQVLPRLIILFFSSVIYYAGRYYFDTLSIPDGLIRPAENPFYSMIGWHRVRNYAYVLAIHIGKAWDLDFIGFSHEYGHECIHPIDSWSDPRLGIPFMIGIIYTLPLFYLLLRQRIRSPLSIGLIHYIVHLSWMVTLFPVSGFIKVGTFISDRIVVAASVSTCIIYASWVSSWVLLQPHNVQRKRQKIFLLGLLGLLMWRRIYNRSVEWTDSLPLLQSSLRTCPRFAKGHLEISKIYSGLYPSLFNLTHSRFHLEQVEMIDPTYCDVHQQFAHVAVQEHKYPEFEERLTKALLCPFTSSGAIPLWQRYWKMVLDPNQNSPEWIAAGKLRYDKFMKIVNLAIEREQANESKKKPKSSSPLVWGRSS